MGGQNGTEGAVPGEATAHTAEGVDRAGRVRFLLDVIHRAALHHGLWFTEVRHQLGMRRALEALDAAWKRSLDIQLNRLSRILGFELEGGLPRPLLEMEDDAFDQLLEGLCANWLVGDGVWFQAVEFAHGMNDAKRCNDSVWAQFAPLEAWSIQRLLGLPERSGLEGLKQALAWRIYARINVQSVVEEGPRSLVFRMEECRVQSARKRKGLPDYPCKSAGLVEYAYFARAIDDRIVTECIGCPPDPHPEGWYCAWRFSLPDG
ncbi:MAG: DUF6125 family protein [Desulfobacterales bacterium]